MKIVFVRAPYNYDADIVSRETQLECDPETDRAQQQFKDEVDINTIVRRFGLTGELPDDLRLPRSGDFTDVTDFASAMLAVRKAQEGFMELPGELRYKFANDPQRLIEFLEDPSNKDEAIKLGLVNKPAEVVKIVEDTPKG